MKIEDLHDKLYEILTIVNRICSENNISYWVDGGTEIGAVRDKNFIPWDDDADIKILAEDYPDFRTIMKKNLPPHLHLIEPQDFSPFFYDMTIRILDDRWFLRKERPEDKAYHYYTNRVGIDVFLFCGCPEGALAKKYFIIKNSILYGMCMRFRYTVDYSKYSLIQKVQVVLLRWLGAIYAGNSPDRILRTWYNFIRTYDANKTGWRIAINSPIIGYYMIALPNRLFSGTVYSNIRDLPVPLILGYDEELRIFYGNYMVPDRNPKKYFTHLDAEDLENI